MNASSNGRNVRRLGRNTMRSILGGIGTWPTPESRGPVRSPVALARASTVAIDTVPLPEAPAGYLDRFTIRDPGGIGIIIP